MKKQYIIPIFVPHLGCPYNCSFCNQKSISGQTKQVTAEDVRRIINEFLRSFKESDSYKEVAFFGGSFTAIDVEKQEELLEAAYEFIKSNKIDSIRISTRPDFIDKKTLKRLKKYKVRTIELGVQTTNNYILEKVGRGHTFEDVKEASKLIRRAGFELGHQMMIGLPESTLHDELNTAKDLIKLKPKMVRIYPVLVIKNTKLEKEYLEGEYRPLSVVQAVERSKDVVYLFNRKKIKVIRIGLQNTTEISSPKEEESQVVAGPFHPAFRQLVESSIWYDSIVDRIKSYNVKVKEVKIKVNPEDVNNVIGHKKENLKKLLDTYDVILKVTGDEKIKPGNSKMNILRTYTDFLEDERKKLTK